MADSDVRRILVVGATGKQGGAVVKALLANPPPFKYEILAMTRSANSASAKSLTSKPNVTILSGDLNDVSAIFSSAGGPDSIWALFLVTQPSMKKLQPGVVDKEVAQGRAMFDAAQENGVKHFVFSSVERGGDEKSWDNPTPIPHFITKHDIELYIRDNINTSQMTYTILRPVAFMDNYMTGIIGRIFAAAWAQMGKTPLQLVSTRDIGIMAAKALSDPESDDFKNKAIGLVGDELNQAGGNQAMWKAKSRPMVQTYWFVAYFLKWAIADVGIMFRWFEEQGYKADVAKCKRLNPDMLDFERWIKDESKHT